MSGNQYLCRFCLLCLFLVALLSVSLYLTYRPNDPSYCVTSFLLSSSAASFGLSVENENKELGIYHDDLALALALSFPSDSPNFTSSAVVPGFYQGHKKTASKTGSFAGGRGWPPPANRSVRVDLRTAVRFQAVGWRTRRHAVSVGAEVKVGADGMMPAGDSIELRSGAPRAGFRCGGTGCTPLLRSILAVAFGGCAALVF
ncbi:protein NDR1-like [Curcuma longa]|uniref:protein NDR1-like n=1 Tax=Curcuma longa TaxID=136217 RepID=UPI003D9E03CE